MSTEEGEVRDGIVSEMDFMIKINFRKPLRLDLWSSQSKQGRGQDFMLATIGTFVKIQRNSDKVKLISGN